MTGIKPFYRISQGLGRFSSYSKNFNKFQEKMTYF